jgi:hypothetical protein
MKVTPSLRTTPMNESSLGSEVLSGDDWYNGTTVWRVTYEYADASGGGVATDYFKTSNRYTPPTGGQIRSCMDSESMTIIAIERIEVHWTDTPNRLVSQEPAPIDAKHNRLFDLLSDRLSNEPPVDFGDL